MMKKQWMLLVGMVLAAVGVVAQPTAEQTTTKQYNSLLWEISGNGLEQPSYLYGTIHLIAKEDFIMSDIVKEKFQTTKQLALEIDMDDPMLMFKAMKGLMMKGGTTLPDLLTDEEYAKVKKHFSDSLGIPTFMLNRVKPILISSMATEEGSGGMSEMESFEMVFVEMAKEQDMKVVGLESAEYQISVLDSIPYEEQAKMLLASLEGDGDMGQESFDEMVELYKEQDLDALYELISSEDSELGAFEDMLLKNRNQNWIPRIAKLTKKQPTFIAVGAGHLPGDFGVINLLRQAGYTVKAIR